MGNLKTMTVCGTRPELIRLSILIEKLDASTDHVLVYTNQNYDFNLSGRFFSDLGIRKPDYTFKKTASFGEFVGKAFVEFEKILKKEKPDKIVILGDTNSGLLAILAQRNGIPVYHLEAGNRCFDERVPEEANRRVIDSVSKINLPYTENSKQNLLDEGYHKNSVFRIGNPILEVMNRWMGKIDQSLVLEDLGITGEYVLVTTHRSENVDNKRSLSNIVKAVNHIAKKNTVILSLHPRTRSKLDAFGLKLEGVMVIDPVGFFDFVFLEKNAKCVISDSGTVQEECCLMNVPSVTIRETTERQETIECGSNILSGTESPDIIRSFEAAVKSSKEWIAPTEYRVRNVSDVVLKIIAGK